jgi:tetratricopeptide (TPR) repeat protein
MCIRDRFALFLSITAIGQTTAMEFYNLAVEQTDQQKYQEAITNYNKAIELNPLFHEACFGLGYSLQQINMTQQAIEKYSQAITLHPNDMYFLQRASAYKEIGKEGLALRDCNDAIKLNPNNTLALFKRATILWSMNQEAAAASDYTLILKRGYANDTLYFELGQIYEKLNMPDSAKKYYEISISKIPTEKYTYIRLAEVQQTQKKYNDALDTFNRLISAFPNYDYAYYIRARLYAEIFHQREQACVDYKKALELGYSEAKTSLDLLCY